MTTQESKRGPIGLHPHSVAILSLLRAAKIGDVVTYEEMMAACRVSFIEDIRGYLRTAAIKALNEYELDFACVARVGYKLLGHGERVADAGRGIKSIRRKAGRVGRKLATIQSAKLSQDDQALLEARKVQVAIIGDMSASKMQRNLAIGSRTSTDQDMRKLAMKALEI